MTPETKELIQKLHDGYCVGDGSVCQLGTMEVEHGCRQHCERIYFKGFRDGAARERKDCAVIAKEIVTRALNAKDDAGSDEEFHYATGEADGAGAVEDAICAREKAEGVVSRQ